MMLTKRVTIPWFQVIALHGLLILWAPNPYAFVAAILWGIVAVTAALLNDGER